MIKKKWTVTIITKKEIKITFLKKSDVSDATTLDKMNSLFQSIVGNSVTRGEYYTFTHKKEKVMRKLIKKLDKTGEPYSVHVE